MFWKRGNYAFNTVEGIVDQVKHVKKRYWHWKAAILSVMMRATLLTIHIPIPSFICTKFGGSRYSTSMSLTSSPSRRFLTTTLS